MDSDMHAHPIVLILALLTTTLLVITFGCWLGWQLLRQNGRILLRLEAIEDRLSLLELEGEPPGNGKTKSQSRSRLNRVGLKAGTPAPAFRLPRVDGGELTLEEYRGRCVLLVFSDPECGPCNQLAPQLEKFHRTFFPATRAVEAALGRATLCPTPAVWSPAFTRSGPPEGGTPNGARGVTRPSSDVAIVMISRREPKANRAKVKELGLTFPVVLQQHWEISLLYGMFATPIAYLIDERGVIENDVAVGVEPILALLASASNHGKEKEVAVA